MNDADRFRLDPRRLPLVEAWPLEQAEARGEGTDPRLVAHRAAKRDDALRRNVVPKSEETRAALADPNAAPLPALKSLPLAGLIERTPGDFHTWRRTKLGDEVWALIQADLSVDVRSDM